MINQIRTECNSGAEKKTVSGSDFKIFITINWRTVF